MPNFRQCFNVIGENNNNCGGVAQRMVWFYCLIICILASPESQKGEDQANSFSLHQLHKTYPDEGNVIHVKFKTKLRSFSDLITRDFHIIQVRLGEDETPVDIHLVRNFELVHSSVVEKGAHAAYHGSFHPNGRVALTATLLGDEDDMIGFSGHIIQRDSHYVLEPILPHSDFALIRRKRTTYLQNVTSISETSATLRHKIYKIETLAQHDNGTHSDVVHVPMDELEKAIEEMKNSSSSNSNSLATTESPGETEDDEEEDVIDLDEDESEDGDEDDSSPTLGNTFASQNANKNKKNQKNQKEKVKTKNNRRKGGRNARNKNPKSTSGKSGVGSKIVEIAVFADAKLTKVWETRYPKEAKKRMRGFILNLVNNMNLLYQQPSLGVPLSFRLVHLEMLSGSPAGLEPSGGEATKYLKSFCKYSGNKNEKGNQWDHSLLLSGHDLTEGGDKLVAGMAWFSTMCLRYWSCSVSEGSSFSTSLILTHELGHSLGMEHDGSGVSKACDGSKFIMSPTTGAGKTTWSTCSSTNLKDFIAKGSPEVGKKDMAAVPTCLTRPSALKNQQIKFSSSKLPGEIYGLEVQCVYECGNKCSPRFVKSQEDVCAMLWCEKPISGGKQVRDAHPALEGSPCGKGKYCRYGKCVKNPGAAAG